MLIPYYEVLAFTNRPFGGNPAGVCPLEKWLPDAQLQAIAAENNLSETAFFVEGENGFDIRWMSPTVEIPLCGHATLASAHVLLRHLGRSTETLTFQSRSSGKLTVTRDGERLVLDFPSQPPSPCEPPDGLLQGLQARPVSIQEGELDYFTVFESEDDIANIKPDFEMLTRLNTRGVIVTAPGHDCDFVSRFFAPGAGIPEDPVTGSAHCALIPYWSKRLGKKELFARQISKRGGEIFCQDRGERVGIGGHAITYVEGKLYAADS